MGKVRVAGFAVSIDGFGAGPRQSKENPLGVRGTELHHWFYPTETFKKSFGGPGGTKGIDNDFAAKGMENVGAWVLGRNMFAPTRGPWDDTWKGWWGDNPPYHVPVFVVTHHARAPLPMQGDTVFHFVTEGPEVALKRAKEAAGAKDVRIGGGVATIRHYLTAGLIDELHIVVSPILLGEGENLFSGLNLAKLGYSVVKTVAGENATHVLINKSNTP